MKTVKNSRRFIANKQIEGRSMKGKLLRRYMRLGVFLLNYHHFLRRLKH